MAWDTNIVRTTYLPSDNYTNDILKAIVQCQVDIASLLQNKYGISVTYDPIRVDRYVPEAVDFNNVEKNLAMLITKFPIHASFDPTKTWLGGTKDSPAFCYLDVNRWFKTYKHMLALIEFTDMSTNLKAGMFQLGKERQVQQFMSK